MDLFAQTSSVIAKKAAVSSDQMAASNIGLSILKRGGNAADAAVATIAAVSVLQPVSCGIGGDIQCMFFRHKDRDVLSLNGSGRTGKNATLDVVKAAKMPDEKSPEFEHSGLWVSVPGAVAGFYEIIQQFGSGKFTMKSLLEPAIALAEDGVPIPYKMAKMWESNQHYIRPYKNAQDILIDDKTPGPGDLIFAPKLAKSLKGISESGPEFFYCGEMSQRIVRAVQDAGGVLTTDDMANHLRCPPFQNPTAAISTDFNGLRIWEMRPNTIGIVALVALNALQTYDLKSLGHNSADYIHLVAEVIKYSYLECWESLCDPKCVTTSVEELLKDETAQIIRLKINFSRSGDVDIRVMGGDTTYVAVVDSEGNGCSLINSVSAHFGCGIIPDDCGFVLHSRAEIMSMDPSSSNVHGPDKLPAHTLMPSIITDPTTGELLGVFGIVGAFMQPQGQVQVLLNMSVFGMDPQVALNQQRFFVGDPTIDRSYDNSLYLLFIESGIDTSVLPSLTERGHKCHILSGEHRKSFGRGHVIAKPKVFQLKSVNQECWWSGADPRSDGCAMGF